MTTPTADAVFGGSVPEIYDRHLVPLIFDAPARELVERLDALDPNNVLEVAAGTGALTRALATWLPARVAITASDLNQPMVDHARSVGTRRSVNWQRADVMDLPFDDASFDAVVCQFGVMFFPDRVGAYREIRRVLRPGGSLLFSTWDRIENNEFAETIHKAVAEVFPDDPPAFLDRTPHGLHDERKIRDECKDAGFTSPIAFEVFQGRSRAGNPRTPALAYCQGTPLRDEIVARDVNRLEEATDAAAAALARRFGDTRLDGLTRGFLVTATRPEGR